MKPIRYRKLNHWKYELAKRFLVKVGIRGYEISTRYLELDQDGLLLIKKGYAWDGASGPTFDTLNSMRASLIHDALYQLIRLKKLPEKHKKDVDLLMLKILRQDGMSRVRSWIWYQAVKRFGKSSCRPGSQKPEKIYTAPAA